MKTADGKELEVNEESAQCYTITTIKGDGKEKVHAYLTYDQLVEFRNKIEYFVLKKGRVIPPDAMPSVLLHWSDREVEVPNHPDDIAEAVVSCALDHSYDRYDGVPWGLPDDVRAKLKPVVAYHLSAIEKDWLDKTVNMDKETEARFEDDVRTALSTDYSPYKMPWTRCERGVPVQISAKDAELLSREPEPLKILIDVKIEE